MKRALICLALAASGSATVPSHAQDATERDAIVAAHKQFVEAWKTCNVNDLSNIVTDDLRFIHINSSVETKAEFSKGVSACALLDLRDEVTNVRMYDKT